MKRIIAILLSLILVVSCLTACDSDSPNSDGGQNSTADSSGESDMTLVDNPTEEYIIACLEATPSITGVAAVTKENDPNGDLNTEGGYYSAVYFSVDLIDQDDIYGDELIDRGTDTGGCIEAYKTVEDAETRNEYLAGYDDSWLFNADYHTVVGTLVIRTSKDLDEDEQKQLEGNIIGVLTDGEIEEPVPTDPPTSETEEEEPSNEVENPTDGKIVMPKSTADYIGSEWTIETITEHFKQLGFTNIRGVPCDPDDDNYKINIREMVIETDWFSDDPWEARDKFAPDAEISIYYNEFPLLTVENCPDLVTVLTSKDMDYISFCKKYDGRNVEFDAYVVGHLTYDGGISHIIDVSGGDYDGQTEINAFEPSTYAGLIIRIGDRTWGNSINESVEIGDHVTMIGRIDLEWAEYYKCLYVETMSLSR